MDMPVLLDAFDARGQIVFWNRECERVTGYSAAEMIGNPRALSLLYPDPVYLADLEANCERRGAAQVWNLRAKNGEVRSIAWTDVLIDPSRRRQVEWGFGLDITERLRLRAAVNDVAEGERKRLGQELHDGLGQTLTGLSLMIQGMARRSRPDDTVFKTNLNQIAALAAEAVKSCRDIALGLLPVENDELRSALQRLVRDIRLQAPEVQVEFEHFEEAELRLPAATCGHLYRMAQESLNNALRHSHADRIRVVFRATATLVTLLLQDNGRGFPADLQARGGKGMRTLRDRADAVNARISIRRLPRGGTQVKVQCSNHGQ